MQASWHRVTTARRVLSRRSSYVLSRRGLPACTPQLGQQQQQHHHGLRCFSTPSDRLMGYSPMAPSTSAPPPASSTTPSSSQIPTAQDVTTSGGVWAPTSAKRDKITELKAALTEVVKAQNKDTDNTTLPTSHPFAATLDDMATPAERLDLDLVDGWYAIAVTVDESNTNDEEPALFCREAIQKWMLDVYREKTSGIDNTDGEFMTKHQLGDYLRRFLREMERHLAAQHMEVTNINKTTNDSPSPPLFTNVRDYIHVGSLVEQLDSPPPDTVTKTSPTQFDAAVQRYRLLLAQSAAQTLLEKAYEPLTTISNHDIDRAAVQGVAVDKEAAQRIPIAKVEALLEAYLWGSASTRVDAWWNLMDRDNDGLLEQEEVNVVCDMAIRPVGKALQVLLQQTFEVLPVRVFADENKRPGWRQRRQERLHKQRLQKMFTKTIANHFVDEVEMPHRLRCIYAWANKAHQDGAVQSVLVDEIAWTGRKRYVELPPKISLPEFRQVQQEHFTHLDRVAAEYLKSFREDLWILQGSGRQRSELIRDCAMFMGAVCGIDYVIISL